MDLVWNIFYHFKIDDDSLALLMSQCEKLVDMSTDLEAWLTSSYSRFLRVCDRHTLSQLNRQWKVYVTAKDFSRSKNSTLWSTYSRLYNDRFGTDGTPTLNFSVARSVGPFWADAVFILGKHFQHFWKTGTLYTDPTVIASASNINPTFIYSMAGEGCGVHYGTYPLQCFHLAPVFCASRTEAVEVSDFISCAKLQFQCWCDSFREAVSPNSRDVVTIRFFAGDALALCHTLSHCHLTSSISASLHVSAWAGDELVLDGGDYDTKSAFAAPTTFNVVDTSNIIDHVGLLNVLIAVVPVLAYGPSSTLYTEGLQVKPGKDAATMFVDRLCADIPAIALIFGLTPTAYVSRFNTHSNAHELMFSHAVASPHYHERVAWRIPNLCDSAALSTDVVHPSFEHSALARLLYDIYYRMFQHEDIVRNLQSLTISNSDIHYHRSTFAALLGLVKSRVYTDWDAVMVHIFDMLHTDHRLILGSNNYQELCCQLHIRGIYSVDTMRSMQTVVDIDRSSGIFKGWSSVPPVVCLVLVVPRSKLQIFEKRTREKVGSPILQVEVRGQAYHNIFSAIQVTLGSVSLQGSGSNACAVLTEDIAGWSGSSPLVVSVWMPAYNLACEQSSPKISLGIHSTPATTMAFKDELGLRMTLFTTELTDSNFVHIVSERPNRPRELACLRASVESPVKPIQRVDVALDEISVATLSAKWDVAHLPNLDTRAEVKHEQVSSCSLKLRWDNAENSLVYPFPIDGSQAKLRVARKSGWVEAIVPVSRPLKGSFCTKNFSPIITPNGPPILWNIHRVNLDHLPVIDVAQVQLSSRLNSHFAMAFSDREASLRQQFASLSTPPPDLLLQVKDTIQCLLSRTMKKNARRMFALADPARGGIYTIIFVNDVRLDLPSHTVVADVCILPLTTGRVNNLGQIMHSLAANGKMIKINTTGDEVSAWKHLLPAFVERCRTWSHKPTCEYLRAGTIPLTVEFDKNPICGCGEGISLGALSKVSQWKRLAPYMTRAAFSQFFAVSFIESVGSALKSIRQILKADTDVAKVCSQCGKSGELFDCSRCKKVRYCGESCQKAAWKQHKLVCKARAP
ncbi:hypothetical protein BKA93DRAFT_213686 [Sparassis latifolia]